MRTVGGLCLETSIGTWELDVVQCSFPIGNDLLFGDTNTFVPVQN